MKKIILLSTILSISSPLFAEDTPGSTLLSYFAANCRTQSDWTKGALADSNALIDVLKNFSQDPDCKSLSGAVTQLGLLSKQLSDMQNLNESKLKIAEYNSQEQELLIHLTQTTDPTSISEINFQLRSLQLNRAAIVGRDKSLKELTGPDKAQAMTNIVQIANSSFSQITGNQKCLAKNPGILNKATAIVTAIGSAATVVNPAIGIGLTAGSTFMGETIEGIRRLKNAKEIRKVADLTTASEAYKCALETMSDRWCQMKDAEAFLNYKSTLANLRPGPGLSSAVKINDREVPALIDWLNKLRNGAKLATTADSDRRNRVLERELSVRKNENRGNSLLEESKELYNNPSNTDEDRWDIIRNIVGALTSANS